MLFSFDLQGQQFPPTRAQKRMLEYAENRRLYLGEQHRLAASLQDEGEPSDLVNFFSGVVNFWHDALVDSMPVATFANGDPLPDMGINLPELVSGLVLDFIRYGDAVVRTRFDGVRVVCSSVEPQLWYPVIDRSDIERVRGHVIAWAWFEGDDLHGDLLLEEDNNIAANNRLSAIVFNYEEGYVETATYMLNSNVVGEALAAPVREALGYEAIVFANFRKPGRLPFGRSMFEDIKDLSARYARRFTGMRKVMDRFTNPSMYGDSANVRMDQATGEATVDIDGQFFPVDPNGVRPGYLVWDASLQQSFAWLINAQRLLLAQCGISPFGYGVEQQAGDLSGRALRRYAFRQALAESNIRRVLIVALRRVFAAALTAFTGEAYTDLDVSVSWDAQADRAELLGESLSLLQSGVIDRASVLSRVDGIPYEVAARLLPVLEVPDDEEEDDTGGS